MKPITVAICHYPRATKSAVYGLEELFFLADRICIEESQNTRFTTHVVTLGSVVKGDYNIVLLPPSISSDYYLKPEPQLLAWLNQQHQQGAVIASACAGAFILAASGLSHQRLLTTHWGLTEAFKQHFPNQPIDTRKILIDHNDIMSAGGMMSWLDLGLELVKKYSNQFVMRKLGKTLVVDTAPREQSYYHQFQPNFQHSDDAVLRAQQYINTHYDHNISIMELADIALLTQRTLQRRFTKRLGLNPNQYLQRFRVQKMCELLESTRKPFDWIAHQVGYEDTAACRKVFKKYMGLTPNEFRQRF
ncbi:GlxA family transcriptional regulator [Pseudoalteromonas piscicida]|uniref:AraC family transcriptional regulator n=1 Tax=Pseudoalteromonas piscicida TaxID=43662 RepID=A0A2A5JP46_PSEO7|nr:AraC family transcriptional regulator [Pseudoalteromonas piscicida]PCK31109.1 AraC family transcriptional regulator [Pseudoalteromonas piscicida]